MIKINSLNCGKRSLGLLAHRKRHRISHLRIAEGEEGRYTEPFGGAPVREPLALRCHDRAACRAHDCVPCGDVPFVRRGEPRVNVGASFGDLAEFDRGAGGNLSLDRKAAEQCRRLGSK